MTDYQRILARVKHAIAGEPRISTSVALCTALEDLGFANHTIDVEERAKGEGLDPAMLAAQTNQIEPPLDYDSVDIAVGELTGEVA